MRLDGERRFSLILLAAVLVVNCVVLWPELSIAKVDLNDNVSHLVFIHGMVNAVETGQNPIDFWSPECSTGFPVFRVYQPLAHGIVTTAYFALGKSVPVEDIFAWVRFLALAMLPLSFFAAAWLLELRPLECAAAALLGPLLAAADRGLFGIEYRSYTWYGYGMFAQSVGNHFLLLAIGLCYRAIRRGTHVTLAGITLAVTCLSHLILGYIGALTACLMTVLPMADAPRLPRLRRLVWIGVVSALLCAFQLLPILQDGYLINRSHYEPVEKWDSFGAGRVLGWLFSGGLMDHDRVPVLTLLAAAGVALAAWRWKSGKRSGPEAVLLGGFVFWLLLYFGRPTWGPLLLLVGITADMHVHRLIVGVQIFLLFLAAMAMAALWREVSRRWNLLGAVAITAVLLFPLVQERAAFLAENTSTGRENLIEYDAERQALTAALDNVARRGGRGFAGMGLGWGRDFKVGYVPVHNFLIERGIPSVSFIYHAMSLPSDLMMHFDPSRAAHYRLFNVRSGILQARPVPLPDFVSLRADYGRFRVVEMPGGGYFDVVDATAWVPATRETFLEVNDPWLKSDQVDRKQHWLIGLNGNGGRRELTPPPAGSAGEVRSERQEGQVYSAEIAVSRPSYLLFKMTWHPNWKVSIDGHTEATEMLSPGFLGVAVKPGPHRVVCRYEPGTLRVWLAIGGVILVLGMFAASALLRGRRGPGVASSPTIQS